MPQYLEPPPHNHGTMCMLMILLVHANGSRRRYCFSVAFFCSFTRYVKTASERIIKFDLEIFHDESRKPIYFAVRGSKVKATRYKTLVRCVFLNSCGWWFCSGLRCGCRHYWISAVREGGAVGLSERLRDVAARCRHFTAWTETVVQASDGRPAIVAACWLFPIYVSYRSTFSNKFQFLFSLTFGVVSLLVAYRAGGLSGRNKWSMNFVKWPHRRGCGFFTADSVMWHRTVWSIAVGCSTPAVPWCRYWGLDDHFAVYSVAETPMLFNGWANPQIVTSHLIHGSVGPWESPLRMASRFVQPFLQSTSVWPTQRQTDRHRPRYVRNL